METDRRAILSLTGALVAGMAGCLGGGTDDGEGPAGGEPVDSNGGQSPGGNGDAATDGGSEGFEGYEAPEFPRLDLVTDPDVPEEHLAQQVRGNVAFSLDLLAELRDDSGGQNLFFSPYSVSAALAMTYAGARGETAAEMAEALEFRLDGADLHPVFGALEAEFDRRNADGSADGEGGTEVSDVDDSAGDDGGDRSAGGGDEGSGPDFTFTTANALWGQEGYPFRDDFLELLDAYYGAGLQLVDFSGSPDEARQRVNEWVAEQTEDRITNVLPEGSIDELTRLVLTNAIYFMGAWSEPFEEGATAPAPFTALDGTETEVQMMRQSLEASYAEIEGHQLVELPYANGQTSMVVILPAEGEFEAFESSFSVDRLATLLGETVRPTVELSMPRFGIESSFGLVGAMQSLGMELAFDREGDLTGMADDDELSVDDVIHKSFVEVDEEGTEAAAATAVTVGTTSVGPDDTVEMTVDRPFLFYVLDRPTETPLFLGRVVDGETLPIE